MTSISDAEALAKFEDPDTPRGEAIVRPGLIDRRGWTPSDLALDIARKQAALEEQLGAQGIGAVLCPSGTHGDFVDGEVVPGDLPCRECGAAL